MSYRHTPLDPIQQHIRLIEILSTANERSTRCAVHNVPLRQAHYTALSYQWGSLDNPQVVTMNDESFFVTENLHDFLGMTQNKSARPMLWIDALCIDQDNLDERSEQVKMMGQIYANAEQVWVWLGTLSISHVALSEVFDVSEPSRIRDASERARYKMQNWRKQQNEEWLDVMRLICSHEYWSRVWIAQEFILGGNVQICVGSQLFSASDLQTMVVEAGNPTQIYPPRAIKLEIRNSRCWHLCKKRHGPFYITGLKIDYTQDRPESSLRQVLLNYGIANSTEWRDRVYGLLGLATDGRYLPVDYNIDETDLLMDVLDLETRQNWRATSTYARFLIRLLNITDPQQLDIMSENVSISERSPPNEQNLWRYIKLQKGGSVGPMTKTHPMQFIIPSDSFEHPHQDEVLCECQCEKCKPLPPPVLHPGDELYALPFAGNNIDIDRREYIILRWNTPATDRFEWIATADQTGLSRSKHFRRPSNQGVNYTFVDHIHVRQIQAKKELWLEMDQQTLIFLLRNDLANGRGPGGTDTSGHDTYSGETLSLVELRDLNQRMLLGRGLEPLARPGPNTSLVQRTGNDFATIAESL